MSKGFTQTDTGEYDAGDITIDPAPPTPDTSPAPFGWASQTGWNTDATTTSEEVTPNAYDTPSEVTVDIGLFSVGGDPFSATPRDITPGQNLTLRHTSASNPGESVIQSATIGGVVGTFQTTTAAQAPPIEPGPGVIFSDDFSGGNLNKWSAGSDWHWSSNEGIGGSPCARVDYTDPGQQGYALRANITGHQLAEVYIYFEYKETARGGGSGCKFIKMFDPNTAGANPPGYANTTFAQQYAWGDHTRFSNGDGSTTSNDTQKNTYYRVKAPSDPLVNMIVQTETIDTRDGQWHTWEVHAKRNANDLRDGLVEVWVDGVLRVSADNIKMRHNSNSLYWGKIGLGEYMDQNTYGPWSLWVDNVVISTDRIGS